MEDFLKMDIFFAAATVVMVVLGSLLAVVLIRAIRILGNIERISENVVQETARLRGDIDKIRARIGSFIQRFFRKRK